MSGRGEPEPPTRLQAAICALLIPGLVVLAGLAGAVLT